MALVICPECGKQISDKAAYCINCGCPMTFIVNQLVDKQKQKPIQDNNTNKPLDKIIPEKSSSWENDIQDLQTEESFNEDNEIEQIEDLFDEDKLNWDDEINYLHKERTINDTNESYEKQIYEEYLAQEYEEYLEELSSYADNMENSKNTGWFYADEDETNETEDGLPLGFHLWNGDDEDW